MEIKIEESLLIHIINSESSKLVGKTMKRWEVITNENDRKKEVKELIYEGLRDIRDLIITCSKSKYAISLDVVKSKESIHLINKDEQK